MTPKGHAIPSKTQLLSYGTPALAEGVLLHSMQYDFIVFRFGSISFCWE